MQDKLFKVELPTLLHVLCSIPPLKDMVTQEHLGEYQNIINEIFVTAPRAVMEENMSKYDPLWNFIKDNKKEDFSLTFDEIEQILNFRLCQANCVSSF